MPIFKKNSQGKSNQNIPPTPIPNNSLLPTENIINLAKKAGVNFGPGNASERIRYFIKLGLLPHAIRKISTPAKGWSSSGRNYHLPSTPIGHLPYWTVERLVEISNLNNNGLTFPQIANKIVSANLNNHEPIDLPTHRHTDPTDLTDSLTHRLTDPLISPLIVKVVPLTDVNSHEMNQKFKDQQKKLESLIDNKFREQGQVLSFHNPQLPNPSHTSRITKNAILLVLVFSLASGTIFIGLKGYQRFSNANSREAKQIAQDFQASGQVLAASSEKHKLYIDADSEFSGTTLFKENITAPNVVYSVRAGTGIAVSAGQNPTVSLDTTAIVPSINSASGPITLKGSGSTSITNSGGTITISSSSAASGITSEADTLSTVTGRGATTSTASSFTGGATIGTSLTLSAFSSNGGVIYTDGSGVTKQVTAGTASQCLLGGTTPSFGSCAAGGSVTSLDLLTGALTIANTSGSGTTVTIDDATTAAKGIASFSSGNFSVTSGAVSIKSGGVTTTEILDATIVTGDIATDTILAGNIAAGAVATSEILDDTITATDIAATLTFADGDYLDLSATNQSTTAEGLRLPQAADCSTNGTVEGVICWDTDGDTLYVGNGTTATSISNPFGASIDSSEITDATIVTGDIATDTILAGNIAAGAVATSEILNGTILGEDLAAGIIISTTGNISTTSTGTITSAGLLTASLGATISGAATSINVSSNFDTNINTGTSTGTVTIGNTLSTAIKLGKFATANGVLYVSDTFGTVAETAASTAPQCLTSASAGAAPAWGSCALGTTGVTSVTGTANQITVSASTGDVTFTLPSDIITPGTLTVTTDLTVNGNTLIGNATSDTVSIFPTTLAFAKENAHTIQITDSTTADTAGAALTIKGAAGAATNAAGGAINITGGGGAGTGTGGALVYTGGAGGATGAGGAFTFTTGAGGATSGTSGVINLKTGTATSGSTTGAIDITSGNATAANSGALTLSTGTTTTSGTTGAISITSGNSAGTSGAVTVDVGTGTAGTISLGATNGRTITIGSSSATGVSITDDNWGITAAGLANFVSVGAATAGTGAFTTFSATPASTNDITLTTDADSTIVITGLASAAGTSSLCLDATNNVITCAAGGVGSGDISGSGTSGQIAFFNGTSSITSEASGFGWDTTNKVLSITSAANQTTTAGVFDLNTTSATTNVRGFDNLFTSSIATGSQYGIYNVVASTTAIVATSPATILYGQYNAVTKSGADNFTTSGGENLYGIYIYAANTSTDVGVAGTRVTFGIYGHANSNIGTNYGGYFSGGSGTTNYGVYSTAPSWISAASPVTQPLFGIEALTANRTSAIVDISNSSGFIIAAGSGIKSSISTACSASCYGNYFSTTSLFSDAPGPVYGVYNTVTNPTNYTATIPTSFGLYNNVSVTGENTLSLNTTYSYGIFNNSTLTGGIDTDLATIALNYGIYSSTTGSTTGTTANYSLYLTSTGADNNYALYANAGSIKTPLDCSAGDQYVTAGSGGVLACGTDNGGSSITWSDIINPTTSLSLSFDIGETTTFTALETTGTFFTYTGTAFTTGEILDITATHAPANGSTNEAIDINITHTPTVSADNFQAINLTTTDGTALANTVFGIQNTLTLTGNAAKVGYADYGLVTSSSTTGDTVYGSYGVTASSGAINGTTRTLVGSYGISTATNATNNASTISNVYGGIFNAVGENAGASMVGNSYGIYTSASGGDNNYNLYGAAITTAGTANYGVFTGNISGATNNYGIVASVTSAASNYALYTNYGNVKNVLGATDQVSIDGSTTPNTRTSGGVLDLAVTSLTSANIGLNVSYTGTATSTHVTKSIVNALTNTQSISGTASQAYGLVNTVNYSGIFSGTNFFDYGLYSSATKSGADTSVGTARTLAVVGISSNTGSTDAGTKNTYGGYFTATGDSAGTSTTYGVYAAATGADTNINYYSNTISTAGTANYGIYVGSVSGATANYGIFVAAGATNLQALTVAGALTANGAVTLGDATSDDITFTGYVASSIIPKTDDTYDLGDNTHRWQDLYLGPQTLHIGTSTTDEAVLSYTTASNTLLLDNTAAGIINIGTTALAQAITIGNNTTTTALNLTSGTGAQTFTSSVATGTGTTSAFVFADSALTSGTGIYGNFTGTLTGTRGVDLKLTSTLAADGGQYGIYNVVASATAIVATDPANNYYGQYNAVTKSGADNFTNSGTENLYGIYTYAANTSTSVGVAGTRNTFGVYGWANSNIGTNYGGYFASGANGAGITNYGVYSSGANYFSASSTTIPTLALVNGATNITGSVLNVSTSQNLADGGSNISSTAKILGCGSVTGCFNIYANTATYTLGSTGPNYGIYNTFSDNVDNISGAQGFIHFGMYNNVSATGTETPPSKNSYSYGIYNVSTSTGNRTAADTQNIYNYGIVTSTVGNTVATGSPNYSDTINYGIYISATGANTNFGAYSLASSSSTTAANPLYGGYFTTSNTGNAAKTTNYGSISYGQTTSTTADTVFGSYGTVVSSGAATTGTKQLIGVYGTATESGGNGSSSNVYAGYFSATGTTSGTGNVYGIYAAGASGDNNYGAWIVGNTMVDLNNSNSSTEAVCGVSTSEGATNDVLDDCTTSVNADYAEIYPTDNNLDYGDIAIIGPETVQTDHNAVDVNGQVVSIGNYQMPKLIKSSTPYSNGVIGIISNNWSDFSSTGRSSVPDQYNPKPVALSGRVPVKVSTENGAVNPGDPLTTSSTAGVAMKADLSKGSIIGKALGSYSGAGIGEVMMFVETSTRYNLAQALQNTDLNAQSFSTSSNNTTIDALGNITTAGDVVAGGSLSAAGGAFTVDTLGNLTSNSLTSNSLTITGDAVVSGQLSAGSILTSNLQATNILTTNLQALAASDLNISLGDSAGSNSLRILDSMNHQLLTINSLGDADFAGTVNADAFVTHSTADLAEAFPTTDDTISAGDLVAVDPNNKEHLTKSQGSYQQTLLGIISTEPGFTLNASQLDAKYLALAGRVPTKVNLENGPIKAGDPITSSSVAGVGMRATQAGRVIGIALEDYDSTFCVTASEARQSSVIATDSSNPGNDNCVVSIIVFVNPSWYTGTSLAANGSIAQSASEKDLLALRSLSEGGALNNTTNIDGTLASSQNVEREATKAEIEELVRSEVKRQVGELLASSQSQVLGSDIEAPIPTPTDNTYSTDIPTHRPTDSPSSTPSAESSASAALATGAQIASETDATLAKLTELMSTKDLSLNTLNLTGISNLAQTQVAGTFSQDGTFVIDYGRQINVLGNTLFLQNDTFAGNDLGILVDIGAGAITIDKNGNLVTKGTITAQNIQTKEITVDTTDANAKSAGSATLATGKNQVTIFTTLVKPGAKILITPTTSTGGKTLYVATKSEFEGFTVALDGTYAANKIEFDWLIVNTSQVSQANQGQF